MANIPEKKQEIGKMAEQERERVIDDVYEKSLETFKEQEPILEKERVTAEELEKVRQGLLVQVADEEEVKKEAKKIDAIDDLGGRINKLVEVAKEQGIFFAVEVAKKSSDPYTLDVFHDLMAKDGFFQRFKR